MERDMMQAGDPGALFAAIDGAMQPPVSQAIVIDLGSGRPIIAVCTYAGGLAEVVTWAERPDGTPVVATKPLPSPALVLAAVKGVRRAGQDHPGTFAAILITEGHATLVA